ncbi:MAG: hypothetical protein ACRDP6_45790 [Actinoallomurus sp.]
MNKKQLRDALGRYPKTEVVRGFQQQIVSSSFSTVADVSLDGSGG